MHLHHYLLFARRPGRRWLYHTILRDYYLPNMANGVFTTVAHVAKCASCDLNFIQYFHKRPLQLFHVSSPLDFVTLDILCCLLWTTRDIQYVLLLTNWYSELTQAIPTFATHSTQVANLFLDQWIILIGILTSLLMDNGPQFVSTFFALACGYVVIKHHNRTAYHLRTNGQAGKFNWTSLTRVPYHVLDRQGDWDLYVQPFTYAYNTQLHHTTYPSPYSFVLSQQPPDPLLLRATTDNRPSATGAHSSQSMRKLIQKRIVALWATVVANMRKKIQICASLRSTPTKNTPFHTWSLWVYRKFNTKDSVQQICGKQRKAHTQLTLNAHQQAELNNRCPKSHYQDRWQWQPANRVMKTRCACASFVSRSTLQISKQHDS